MVPAVRAGANRAQRPPPPPPLEAYPAGRIHSPLTPRVTERLKRIAKLHPEQHREVFAKVGDSITASGDFLYCFSPVQEHRLGRPDFDGREALANTRNRIAAARAQDTDPFARVSRAARVGWSAWHLLLGGPNPLEQEVAAIHPGVALVMLGTNDVEREDPIGFAHHLWDITETLLRHGTLPVLWTLPPRRDKNHANSLVSLHNQLLRGLAESSQLPLVDYHAALARLPREGMGKDGIHPSVLETGHLRRPCDLTARGLAHGYNLRNLLALEALERLQRGLSSSESLDPPETRAESAETPLVLPYRGSFSGEEPAVPEQASGGCSAPAVGGRLLQVLHLKLPRELRVRVLTVSREGMAPQVLWRGPGATDAPCRTLERRGKPIPLAPGEHRFTLYRPAGSQGPALFLLTPE